jgi:hypothetical protein
MEESQRTQDASVKLLDRWAIYFYPERPDLFMKIQAMATELGGRINTPQLRPKYRWIQRVFGWRIAKKAQHLFPTLRSLLDKSLDR